MGSFPGSFDITASLCPASGKTISQVQVYINQPGNERYLGDAVLVSGTSNTYKLNGQSTTSFQAGYWYNNTSGFNYGLIQSAGSYSFFVRVFYDNNAGVVISPVVNLNVNP